ncbi:MAG: hypothetical protein NC828_05505 [Candidatus Omnitrophica bacterium]|nr:hypothetical protein [Candidatus Omnitrophota bacterium]
MEKKEFPKKAPTRISEGTKAPSPPLGLSAKAFGIIKFILGLLLLPFVYALTKSFLSEAGLIGLQPQRYFWAGIASFIIVHLFIYEPAIIYRSGHRMLEDCVQLFAPLVKVAPYVLPIYAIVVFGAYLLLSLIIKSEWLTNISLFLIGFSFVLHLTFSAKAVRAKQGDFLKANYIFGFSFIYIVNVLLVSLILSAIFKDFSFVRLFKDSYSSAQNVFYVVFKQLFL